MKNLRVALLRNNGFEDLVCLRKKLYLVLDIDHLLLYSVMLTSIKEGETHFIDQRDSLPGMLSMPRPTLVLCYPLKLNFYDN